MGFGYPLLFRFSRQQTSVTTGVGAGRLSGREGLLRVWLAVVAAMAQEVLHGCLLWCASLGAFWGGRMRCRAFAHLVAFCLMIEQELCHDPLAGAGWRSYPLVPQGLFRCAEPFLHGRGCGRGEGAGGCCESNDLMHP